MVPWTSVPLDNKKRGEDNTRTHTSFIMERKPRPKVLKSMMGSRHSYLSFWRSKWSGNEHTSILFHKRHIFYFLRICEWLVNYLSTLPKCNLHPSFPSISDIKVISFHGFNVDTIFFFAFLRLWFIDSVSLDSHQIFVE